MNRLVTRRGAAHRQSDQNDPLAGIVVRDLLVTTASFLLSIAAVVLMVKVLSAN